MVTPQEFMLWVESLPDPIVRLHQGHAGSALHTINLMTLTKDILQHEDFRRWWKGKNMPPHLNNTIARTILDLDPPENIRAAMMFMIL